MTDNFPLLHAAFRTGPFEKIGGWAHAIPAAARAEIIRALVAADRVPELTARINDALHLEHKPGAGKRDIIAALKGTDR